MGDPQGHRITELDSGVRVVTERMPGVRSIALGFGVLVGSRDETAEEAGLSHFLEHLLFKGTDRFSSTEIDEIFDGMGAEVNAGTGKETTTVYSRFLDQHLERAFDVMADMVLRPSYPDIDSEREVVIEEIAMYEDEPSDKVHDVLDAAIFGEHPLGRPVIGRAEVISSVPVPAIAAYHHARYVPGRLVVAASGNVGHDDLVALARSHCEPRLAAANGSAPERLAAPAAAEPALRFHVKDTEQYHLCVGGRGPARADERRFVARVLDTILGGSTSSRLFQEVRERRGLAYSVYSYANPFVDAGKVAVYVGTRPANVEQALEVIGSELRRLAAEGAEAEELSRARENVKGRTVLAMESTMARMNRLLSGLLTGVPLLSLDEMVAAVDAVDATGVAELATEVFDPGRMSVAGVGRDEDAFAGAAGAVNPALAPA